MDIDCPTRPSPPVSFERWRARSYAACTFAAIVFIGLIQMPSDRYSGEMRIAETAGLLDGAAEPSDEPVQGRRSLSRPLPNRGTSGRRKRLRSGADTANFDGNTNPKNFVTQDVHNATIRAYEQRLIQIGQDLHDGPIQLLTIFKLRLHEIVDAERTLPAHQLGDVKTLSNHLIVRAMAEMRDICAGLVFPGLDGLSVEQTIRLAVRDHEQATGRSVSCEIADLAFQPSPQLRICLYKIIQESLNNSYKYATDEQPRASAFREPGGIAIVVRDGGADPTRADKVDGSTGFGLSGLKRQLEFFGGSLNVETVQGSTIVTARLTIDDLARVTS